VKLQPQHVDFLEISDPRAVLEYALRNFSCVTKGDVIQLPFNNKNYHFELKEVEPQDAACIIETDCNVDFDAPVGYTENHGKDASSSSSSGGGVGNAIGGGGGGAGGSNSVDESLLKTIANTPKQSALANPLSSTLGTNFNPNNSKTCEDQSSAATEAKLKIVDGKIVRPDDDDDGNNQNKKDESSMAMMASQTGGTGVQRNSAIAVKAPQVDYWAVNAGDGARLDGKQPSILKDSQGNEVDVRKLRAEAAARRLAALNSGSGNGGNGSSSMPSGGKMVNGKVVENVDGDDGASNNASGAKKAAAASSMRKSRVGSKYSKLKQSGGFAFQGSANTFKK